MYENHTEKLFKKNFAFFSLFFIIKKVVGVASLHFFRSHSFAVSLVV